MTRALITQAIRAGKLAHGVTSFGDVLVFATCVVAVTLFVMGIR